MREGVAGQSNDQHQREARPEATLNPPISVVLQNIRNERYSSGPETFEQLKIELKSQLHCPRIGLYVCNFAELAPKLVNYVRASVSVGWQTPSGIGDSKVLMIKGVKHVPPELEVTALGNVKVFLQ